jgi:hypothetical protein
MNTAHLGPQAAPPVHHSITGPLHPFLRETPTGTAAPLSRPVVVVQVTLAFPTVGIGVMVVGEAATVKVSLRDIFQATATPASLRSIVVMLQSVTEARA